MVTSFRCRYRSFYMNSASEGLSLQPHPDTFLPMGPSLCCRLSRVAQAGLPRLWRRRHWPLLHCKVSHQRAGKSLTGELSLQHFAFSAFPAARSLQRDPCSAIPAAPSLQRHPCSAIPAAQSLQRHPCSAIPAARSLLWRSCSTILEVRSLWQHSELELNESVCVCVCVRASVYVFDEREPQSRVVMTSSFIVITRWRLKRNARRRAR